MKSDTPLDYAIFQLSPKRSRCELYVSKSGNTEKLASGSLKPFVTHLKVAEEQAASMFQTIKLEVEKNRNADTWFTKGTLERFVRFVSTPEVLELVSTYDAEMSQLEAARRIYSQGAGDQPTGSSGGDGAAADATKKELLRAIDVRLSTLRQDLTTSYTRAISAGFTPDAVSELQLFADQFGAGRLNESCSKFISLCDRRPDLINPWKAGSDDRAVRSSCGSDMSIDEDPPDDLASGPNQHPDQSKPTTLQHLTKSSSFAAFPLRRSRESSVDREEVKESEEKKEESGNKELPPVKTSHHIRRLSVQDRINLFENKQKESGGKPVVVGKSAELRRLSSDVSFGPAAAEKAVLRRWSGVSDMSISLDLTGDKKDLESPVCTPSSSTVSQTKSEDFESKNDMFRVGDGGKKQDEVIETKVVSVEANMLTSTLERVESDFRKYQIGSKNQAQSSRTEEDSLMNQIMFQPQVNSLSDERVERLTDQKRSKASISGQVRGEVKEQAASESQNRNIEFRPNRFDSLTSQVKEVSFKAVEQVGTNETGSSKMKSQKQDFLMEKGKKVQTKREESNFGFTYNRPVSSSKMVSEGEEDSVIASALPVEQVQRAKQPKGNQELNDELKLKANELEKLFAEHKRRGGPGEVSSLIRRNKTAETQMEEEVSLPSRKQMEKSQPAPLPEKKSLTESMATSSNITSTQMITSTESLTTSCNMTSYCVTPPVKSSGNLSDGESLKKDFSEFGLSDDCRGKFYDKYKQKRDAKLREEWGSHRAEKEAKMKAIEDSFEKSRAEMEAKFAGSSYKQDSALSSHRRAERLRSFNSRSTMKREQHPIDLLRDEEAEEDLSDFVETTPLGHARSLSETSLGDSTLKGPQTKRILPNKTLSSRTSVVPVPKSASKGSNSSYGRRKMQAENPLAQSVPNFSELRKENAKPSSGITKPTRLQARNYSRNRNTSEENNPIVREEKSRRSQSLRKSSAGPAEFKEWSSLDSDGVSLNKEQSIGATKDVEPKPFLRKGNGVGPGAGTLMAKMKASMASEILKHEEENFEEEDLDTMKYEEEKEEPELIINEDHHENDDVKPRLSQDSGSENGDILSSFSHLDSSFAAESPVSWNSRMQHAFSYANEASEEETGSPASWNQAEVDAARMRKKWGTTQKPFVVSSSSQPRKDMTKGFKRLLKFGRKSRGNDSLVDWISATTSEGDDDTDDGRELGSRLSEDLKKSRMGFSQTHIPDDGFNESEFYNEQVQALRTSIPTPPAHFKLREDHLSGSSIKAPRSFFSLSSFRSKASDSKPR